MLDSSIIFLWVWLWWTSRWVVYFKIVAHNFCIKLSWEILFTPVHIRHKFVQFLSQIAIEFADRYNTALVCHRWRYLACHPRLWLRVDRSVKDLTEPGVFPNIETAVAAARFVNLYCLYIFLLLVCWVLEHDIVLHPCRPGDTILIAAGGRHLASNIQISKPLCLVCLEVLGHSKNLIKVLLILALNFSGAFYNNRINFFY